MIRSLAYKRAYYAECLKARRTIAHTTRRQNSSKPLISQDFLSGISNDQERCDSEAPDLAAPKRQDTTTKLDTDSIFDKLFVEDSVNSTGRDYTANESDAIAAREFGFLDDFFKPQNTSKTHGAEAERPPQDTKVSSLEALLDDNAASSREFGFLDKFFKAPVQPDDADASNAESAGTISASGTTLTADEPQSSIQGHHNRGSVTEDFQSINIDRNDETMIDPKFLGMYDTNPEIVKDVKQTFLEIFEEYLNPMTIKNQRHQDALSGISDSVYEAQQNMENLQSSRKARALANMSSGLRHELFERTKDSLAPTLQYISEIPTSSGLAQYFSQIVDSWKQKSQRVLLKHTEDIYLTRLLSGSPKLGDAQLGRAHEQWLESMHLESKSLPSMPELNVITLPTIFNWIIKNASFRLCDGQLSMSLFNLVKRDLATYTIMCNQETYNEVLRTLWIYNGKSSLFNVEMTFTEMRNNGFTGDVVTFNILKQIIVDYHNMKQGKIGGRNLGTPIWSKEESQRIQYLERQLHALAKRIL